MGGRGASSPPPPAPSSTGWFILPPTGFGPGGNPLRREGDSRRPFQLGLGHDYVGVRRGTKDRDDQSSIRPSGELRYARPPEPQALRRRRLRDQFLDSNVSGARNQLAISGTGRMFLLRSTNRSSLPHRLLQAGGSARAPRPGRHQARQRGYPLYLGWNPEGGPGRSPVLRPTRFDGTKTTRHAQRTSSLLSNYTSRIGANYARRSSTPGSLLGSRPAGDARRPRELRGFVHQQAAGLGTHLSHHYQDFRTSSRGTAAEVALR